MPKDSRARTRAVRARMAETGQTYTQAAASAAASPRMNREHDPDEAVNRYRESHAALSSWPDGEPAQADPYGGHEFEYESTTDLFRCTECRVYEVVARDVPDGDPIKPCPGMAAWGGDPGRVYLLLTENPELPEMRPDEPYRPPLAVLIRTTGLGRAPRYSWRDGRQLIETAPSVVDELTRQVEAITYTANGQQVPAASSIEHLTGAAARAILAKNYAAYVAEYGEPA